MEHITRGGGGGETDQWRRESERKLERGRVLGRRWRREMRVQWVEETGRRWRRVQWVEETGRRVRNSQQPIIPDPVPVDPSLPTTTVQMRLSDGSR